ncbi:MAG: hypothetical protein R3C44_12035 [Chloroflexota bacterium]
MIREPGWKPVVIHGDRSTDAARAAFERVLELQPDNLEVRMNWPVYREPSPHE